MVTQKLIVASFESIGGEYRRRADSARCSSARGQDTYTERDANAKCGGVRKAVVSAARASAAAEHASTIMHESLLALTRIAPQVCRRQRRIGPRRLLFERTAHAG